VLTLKTVAADPPPAEEDIPEGVSAPVGKKPVRKTRAGKRTFVPPTFPSAPSSIAARVAARKSSRGVVYSEKRVRVFIFCLFVCQLIYIYIYISYDVDVVPAL
jgi:hypothetical protein